MRQITKWGYIDWEYLPDEDHPGRWFNCGKVTILPGMHQPLHVHYGNEQFLYVLSGDAVATFNGVEHHLKPGDHLLLEANTTHETYNHGSEPYVEYMVANPLPNSLEPPRIINRPVTLSKASPEYQEQDRIQLNLAAENLKATLMKDVSIHICLTDIDNNIILRNGVYPDYCLAKCDPINNPMNCDCYTHEYIDQDAEFSEQPSPYVCKKGMQLFWYPVFIKGRVAGTLRGGRHYSSQNTNDGFDPSAADIYDTPYSTQLGISRVVQGTAESLISYCEMLDAFQELTRQKDELNNYMKETDDLKRSLSDIEETVTDLRINHHFLFNTLNCLANMSLTGDRMDLYQSVIDLSRLFRYTMSIDRQATLNEEIEYLKSYLNLQKLRWRDSLIIEYNVDPSCLNTVVPFNFLQPIAENAFTHAFLTYEDTKRIWIDVTSEDKFIRIDISNNGDAPAETDLERISLAWSNGSGHGLSFIYDKLRAAYDDRFAMSLDVVADPASGKRITKVTVTIPRG